MAFETQEDYIMVEKAEDLTNVPASVIKQQKDADRKIKEQANPPAAATQVDEPIVADLNIDPPAAAAVPVIDPPAAAPVQPAISDGTTDDGQWQHKYSVLQGKYNKEVGDLKSMALELKEKMDRQEIVIQGLNSKHSEQSPKSVDIDDLNPEDFTGWGDEMKTMVTTVNKLKGIINDQNQIITGLKEGTPAAAAPADEGLKNRVESLETNANDTRIQTYLKHLDTNIKGNWRAMNKDAKFNKWLAGVDPISLVPRSTSLVTAAENLRGPQVTSIFNLYIAENGGDAGVTIADELPAGGGDGGGNEDLTKTVAVTQEDVKKAQSDFVQGRITEEDFDKIYSKFQLTLRG